MKNLKAFHIFDVVADSASLTEAANKLHVTHGAVSKQIKILESALSVELFTKQGRNLRLTHEGKLLKNYTSQAFQALNTGVNTLEQLKGSCLEVSCEPTLTMRWLMPRMAYFYQQNPKADIRLSTAGGPVMLGENGLSLAIRRDDFAVKPGYIKKTLVDEWVGPVFAPDYWQQVKNDLSNVKLIDSDTRPNAWENWANKSENHAFSDNSRQAFAHFYFCFQAAVDGLGAALGSYPLVVDDIKRGNLIAPFGFVLSGHRYILLSQATVAEHALACQFSQWLQHNLTACVPTSTEKLSMG